MKKSFTSGRGPSRHQQPSPRLRPEYENKDEFNADTFGEAALSGLDGEFHFGGVLPPKPGSTKGGEEIGNRPSMRQTTSLGDLDPAIALVTTRSSPRGHTLPAEEEVDEGPPGMTSEISPEMSSEYGMGLKVESSPIPIDRVGRESLPAPTMTSSMSFGSLSPRRTLTLDEIEARLNQVGLRPDEEMGAIPRQGRWLPPRNSEKSTVISFPHHFDDETVESEDDAEQKSMALSKERPDSPWERNRGILTKFEREGVARIHLSQLSTEHAEVEDYYYRSYARRMASRRGRAPGSTITPPLYLPLPTPKRRDRAERDRGERSGRDKGERDKSERTDPSKPSGQAALMREALASALGKSSASSSKRPRQQLVVPTFVPEPGESEGAYSAPAAVELIYQAVFRVEDSLTAPDNGGHGLENLQEARSEAIDLIDRQLGLRLTLEELSRDQKGGKNATELTRFLNILALPKAKKILGRALKAIDSVRLSERLLTRLVEVFEYLDVCRVDASENDINLFVNCLLAGLVPHVAKAAGWEEIEAKLQLMLAKRSLSWVAGTKAGLVLLCILLSRGEILKGTAGEEIGTRWSALVERLFDQLCDRLPELFTSLQGADGEFYGWQFMALMALNVDADRKRQMVMELRERILVTANAPDQVTIDNLNIFLNALGLDASHLRGEQ